MLDLRFSDAGSQRRVLHHDPPVMQPEQDVLGRTRPVLGDHTRGGHRHWDVYHEQSTSSGGGRQ